MSMPLDFVQLEFWTYGFMGAVYTNNLWVAPGLAFYMWFSMVLLAIHREDPADLQFDFHSWPVISLVSGLWAGFWLSWSLRQDVLIDTSMKNQRNKKRHLTPEFTLIAIGALIALLGYYYFNGDFSDGFGTVPVGVAFWVGIALMVVGLALAIGTIIWALVGKEDRFNKAMNIKYTLALAIGITVAPALYDYPHNFGLDPYHGFLALGGIVIYWLLMYVYIGWVVGTQDNETKGIRTARGGFFDGKKGREDSSNIDRFQTKREAVIFIVAGGLSQFIVYVIGYIVDVYTADEPWPVVVAIAASSLVISVFFIAVRQWFRKGNDSYTKLSQKIPGVSSLLDHPRHRE